MFITLLIHLLVHPKNEILSSFTCSYVVPKLCRFVFVCFVHTMDINCGQNCWEPFFGISFVFHGAEERKSNRFKTIRVNLIFGWTIVLIWFLMNVSHMATINYILFRNLMFSLLIYIVKLCCLIADVQLLILECTVSWQPIRRERPPPRLLSVSGVSASFLLISFSFGEWSFLVIYFACFSM